MAIKRSKPASFSLFSRYQRGSQPKFQYYSLAHMLGLSRVVFHQSFPRSLMRPLFQLWGFFSNFPIAQACRKNNGNMAMIPALIFCHGSFS